ncbi:MAG: hypothetical protein ACLFR8_07110 [Alkalispirochaeta sp.]
MIDYLDPYHTVRRRPPPERTDTPRSDTAETVPEEPTEPIDSDPYDGTGEEYRDEGEQVDEYA